MSWITKSLESPLAPVAVAHQCTGEEKEKEGVATVQFQCSENETSKCFLNSNPIFSSSEVWSLSTHLVISWSVFWSCSCLQELQVQWKHLESLTHGNSECQETHCMLLHPLPRHCSWYHSRPSNQFFVPLQCVSKVLNPTVSFRLDFSFICLLSVTILQPWCYQLQGSSLIGREKHYKCIQNPEGFSKSLVYTNPCFQAQCSVPIFCNTE